MAVISIKKGTLKKKVHKKITIFGWSPSQEDRREITVDPLCWESVGA